MGCGSSKTVPAWLRRSWKGKGEVKEQFSLFWHSVTCRDPSCHLQSPRAEGTPSTHPGSCGHLSTHESRQALVLQTIHERFWTPVSSPFLSVPSKVTLFPSLGSHLPCRGGGSDSAAPAQHQQGRGCRGRGKHGVNHLH